jgi:hypothetical protein
MARHTQNGKIYASFYREIGAKLFIGFWDSNRPVILFLAIIWLSWVSMHDPLRFEMARLLRRELLKFKRSQLYSRTKTSAKLVETGEGVCGSFPDMWANFGKFFCLQV